MQAFVPKNRRPRFDLTLRVIDLNNVPLSGASYVKWHLPSSTEHHGQTDKAVIQDHKAIWDYEKALQVRMTIGRDQMLQECEIFFEIFQEFGSGGKGDRTLLGRIRLNLAEYVDKSDYDEGITRRYLMQDSKINSTLKIGILMHQVDGDNNFITPPLKSAMVFGGIAGVVSQEQGDPDELGRISSINGGKSRETGDLQDMYRRTLAASWTCRAGELPPDQLIEELFSGREGWATGAQSTRSGRSGRGDDYEETSMSDADSRRTLQGPLLSPALGQRPKSSSSDNSRNEKGTESPSGSDGLDGRGSIERQLYDNTKDSEWRNRKTTHEISEFDVREDLRSWEVSVKN
ncbi:hypothetical protein VTN02DRAFT_155 [Thermoascus thermophilus]